MRNQLRRKGRWWRQGKEAGWWSCWVYVLGFVRGEKGGVWFYVPSRIKLQIEWTGKLLRTNCSVFNLKGGTKEMVIMTRLFQEQTWY